MTVIPLKYNLIASLGLWSHIANVLTTHFQLHQYTGHRDAVDSTVRHGVEGLRTEDKLV